MAAPKLTLTYFPLPGRAEVTRLALFMGGVEFEDKRINFEEFGKGKAEGAYVLGSLPVLQVGDRQLAQSGAMARYAARVGNANLYPADPLEGFMVDFCLDTFADATAMISPTLREKDEEKKKQAREQLLVDCFPRYLGPLEKMAASSGSEYFAGGAITIADLQIAVAFNWFTSGVLDHVPAAHFDAYPTLKKITAKVAEHPKVKEWRAAHP